VAKVNLKVIEDNTPLTPARQELRDAIADFEQAARTANAANEAVELAAGRLRATERAHVSATSALEEARAPRRSFAELSAGLSESEMWELSDTLKAAYARPPVSVDELRKLRAEAETAEDELIAARMVLDSSRDAAAPTASALARATDRRKRAVFNLVRPEIPRLMGECQDLIEGLSAARAALRAAAKLLDPYDDTQREVVSFFSRPLLPEEMQISSDNNLDRRNSALAAWAHFGERITQDAGAEFPTE
jgi:chromosome segregation ATPase